MPFHYRRSLRLGPLRLTFTGLRRRPSIGLHAGPVGYHPRTGRWSIRLPGPFRWISRGRR